MLKTIAIVVAGLLVVPLVAILGLAATKPEAFRVERTAPIKAPPEKLFALVNDLHGFNAWNPYRKKDPKLTVSYSGPAAGRGAAYAWESGKVGSGRMEITDTASPSRVTMNLDFLKPFKAHNVADFTFEPQGNRTTVTWAMHGPMPYVSKVLSVFVDLDRMIGTDFEAGLADLKALAEA